MWMLECTLVCVSALVFIRFPPCKCLIVCVGNNSPIPQGMKQARKDPGPKHPETPRARDPQENHRRDNRGLHPEKGRGEPEGGTSDSHSVGAPGCRGGKPAGSTGSRPPQGGPGPGPGDPKAPHPQSGPSKASRARPRQSTAESGPALARASCPGARNHQRTGGILHRQGMVVGWGRLRWWVRRSLRPDLTHRRRRQAHIYTSICSHPHARKRIFTPSPHM